jgi:carboxypeptidase family protein
MKATWKIAVMTMLSVAIAAPAFAAAICGVARNAQNQPIAGLPVTCKDNAGNVLGQATTDAQGRYVITGLPQGTVDVFIEGGGTPYKPGSGVLNLTEASADVNWELSPASAALAAQNGVCDAAAGWTSGETAAAVVLGTALAAGVGITVWAFESDLHDRHHHAPTSPSD